LLFSGIFISTVVSKYFATIAELPVFIALITSSIPTCNAKKEDRRTKITDNVKKCFIKDFKG